MSKILDWWRQRKYERDAQARTMEAMLSDEERSQQPIPEETYLSAARD